MGQQVAKAHAYGNDFLLVPEDAFPQADAARTFTVRELSRRQHRD
jgi:diaminopimelate epimerase